MKIYRRGARRYHGWTPLTSDERPEVSFKADENAIFLHVNYQRAGRAGRSRDPEIQYGATQGLFKFQVNLTLEDVGKLIAVLAKDGTSQAPSDRRDALKPHVSSLLKLISCAKGFTLKRIRTSRTADDSSSPNGDAAK